MLKQKTVTWRVALLSAFALCVLDAQAMEFEWGGFTGSFDTTLSLGAAVRMEDPDPGSNQDA